MILRAIHWVEAHTPALKALFLLVWAIAALLCGLSTVTLAIVGQGRVVPEGIVATFACSVFFLFFRGLFQFTAAE